MKNLKAILQVLAAVLVLTMVGLYIIGRDNYDKARIKIRVNPVNAETIYYNYGFHNGEPKNGYEYVLSPILKTVN